MLICVNIIAFQIQYTYETNLKTIFQNKLIELTCYINISFALLSQSTQGGGGDNQHLLILVTKKFLLEIYNRE